VDDSQAKRALLVLIAFLLAPTARAADKKVKIDCPHVQDLSDEVFNCGSNKFAAMEAQACSDQVVATWTQASDLLKPLLARDAGNKQDTAETNTSADYEKAIKALDAEILLMQNYTALIASYASVTFDFPDGRDDSTSPDCFNKPFHQIQDIVSNLDKEIVRAKKVRKLAAQLRGTSDAYHKNLSMALSDAIATGSLQAKSGAHARPVSDITGIEEARARAKATRESGKTVKLDAKKLGGLSDITGTDGAPARNTRAPVVRLAEAAAQTFDTRNKLVPEKYDAKAKTGESVGASLWKDPGVGDKLALAVGGGSTAAAAGGTASSESGAAAGGSDGKINAHGRNEAAGTSSGEEKNAAAIGFAGSPEISGAEGTARAGSGTPLASAEVDLFQLVHDRYRATDLFRQARVSTVPLDGFAPSLKR